MTLRLPARLRVLAPRLPALPAYVYDLSALDAHVAAIRSALPRDVEFYYAVKANPDIAILRTVARHTDGFEISSGGELDHVRGVRDRTRVSLGGPGKTSAEISAAVAAGVHRFHVESPHELGQLAAAARQAGRPVDVLFRANIPARAGQARLMMGGPSPFGMDPELLGRCAALLSGLEHVRLRGLHAHLASGLDADELLTLTAAVLDFGRDWCGRHGVKRPEFNIGGGMAVDYLRPDRMFDWARYGRGLAALARPGETLRIEPGRAVTAYCGWYVTRVLDVKRSHGAVFAVLSGGTHHLRTPAAKGHDQPVAVVPVRDWPVSVPRPSAHDEPVTLCGQLCTPKDVLARRVRVRRVRAGDLMVFGLAGAYAWNISHQAFLMHPPPAFHYLSYHEVRPNERGFSDASRLRAWCRVP